VNRIRLTARLRLTMAYLALFIVLGAGLAFANYRLLDAQLARGSAVSGDAGTSGSVTAGLGGVTTLTPGEGSGPAPTTAGPQQSSVVSASSAVAELVDDYRSTALSTLLRTSLLSLLGATVLAGLLVWLVAHRALRPLQSMNATATQITEHNLDERLATGGPRDELRDLGETFNAMLDRLEAAFAHERRLVANASHELGTPLANQRTLLEVTLDDPDATPERLREVCTSVLEQNIRAERLLSGMLTMARAGQAELRTEPVRLDEAVVAAVAAVDTGTIDVRPGTESCVLEADPFLLERLLTNLIVNAARHNVPDGWIEVAVRRADDRVELTIRNSCTPIDPLLRDTLLEPFRRGTGERTGSAAGSGLGLAIVAAIAEAHGWALDVDLTSPGTFAVTVTG